MPNEIQRRVPGSRPKKADTVPANLTYHVTNPAPYINDAAEVTELQRLAESLPSNAMRPLPDASSDRFIAPMQGNALETIQMTGDTKAWGEMYGTLNLIGGISTGIISLGVGIATGVGDAGFNLAAFGFSWLGCGVVGNAITYVTSMVNKPAYERISKLNAMAFTRWLRLRHNVIVDPGTLGDLRLELNGESALGKLGRTITDVNGQPFTLHLAGKNKKYGIDVKFDLGAIAPPQRGTKAEPATAAHAPAVENLFIDGDIGAEYKTIQMTIAKLHERPLDPDSVHTIERVQEDVEDLKVLAGNLLDLHPLTGTQTKMLVDTLHTLADEVAGVLATASAAAERSLEIQYRYIQERQERQGLSLNNESATPNTGG